MTSNYVCAACNGHVEINESINNWSCLNTGKPNQGFYCQECGFKWHTTPSEPDLGKYVGCPSCGNMSNFISVNKVSK